MPASTDVKGLTARRRVVTKPSRRVSCTTSSGLWHTMLMACYSSHSSDIDLFGMGEYETFFDRCGQALVIRVHGFLHSETRYALSTGVLAILTNFTVTNTRRKFVNPAHSAH